ncbi:MAG TPA: hypothetical protein VGT03_03935 [Candidatus Acidoferrales bacterium]|nr:hypothetical protein [Candidatus Acidoferrales bacterium]
MDRRRFLRNLAVTTAALRYYPTTAGAAETLTAEAIPVLDELQAAHTSGPAPLVEGHTLLCEFKSGATRWKVYEDLRTRDGAITFLSASGSSRVLPKSAEAVFAEANPPYLGLDLKDIGMSGRDLLADKLLANGDPDPEMVKAAAPPMGSATGRPVYFRLPWNTFVGTKECFDTMPVYPSGNTRTYHPVQEFPELNLQATEKRFEGLIGGWMPAVRKVMPVSDTAYDEVVVFGDTQAHDKFIVQTWHRTARIEDGKITKVEYGYSYPPFPPAREDPSAEDFYRALLIFAGYWDKQLHDCAPAALPENSWSDMSKHAFAKELMVRPGGVYPKYGAVDRDYYGSEYDGFQDIFTMSVITNLEWGRFDMARTVIDNYLTDFTDAKGMINMRGPETAQFGMELMLFAKYFNYTRDGALLLKHREKIEATAEMLCEMHDESLRLPAEDPGHGLIHGWSESDSCLAPKPATWWLPYFANSAFAARGLKDLSEAWRKIQPASATEKKTADWMRRSKTLQDAVTASMEKSIRKEMNPPYIGTYPGTTMTVWESMEKERPSPQQWAHRPYAELLQADMLPAELANTVIDCMRAYGGTTLGVVANMERPHPTGRDILGFISYGYAQMLLRLDRVEEYLLFLYSHRYHDHSRGSWTAGEVSGIEGGTATFCIPAQQTIPLLVRWMLVLEDSDDDRLYLAKGLPRDWVASGRVIRIEQAPTRWGRVSLKLAADTAAKRVSARVTLERPGAPKELRVKFRLPSQFSLRQVMVNGRAAKVGGLHNDMAIFQTGVQKEFEVIGSFA